MEQQIVDNLVLIRRELLCLIIIGLIGLFLLGMNVGRRK